MSDIKSKAKFWLSAVVFVATFCLMYYGIRFHTKMLVEAFVFGFIALFVTLFTLFFVWSAWVAVVDIYKQHFKNKKE